MKKLLTLGIAALAAMSAYAAEMAPSFNATLTVGKESRFVLVSGEGKSSSWLKVGDSFAGYQIKAYDAKASALDLEKDGKVTRVALAADAGVANGTASGASGTAAMATVEEATAFLDAMHFEQMLDKTLAAVKRQQLVMVDRMMKQMAGGAEDREAVSAFQQKLVSEMMNALSGAELKSDVAKMYSEVFTKDELQGLSAFYSSPVGQSFNEKQPVVAEKMQQIMMPRMMAVMPKIQQMAQQFAAEQQAKKAAAATPAPAPTPAPGAGK